MTDALPSMKCVCGHWDTEHASFTSEVRPGRTRTFCDNCGCRSWMTPEDERSPATGMAGKSDMRNLVGEPVVIGAVTARAATTYTYGGSTYQGGVQRRIARDRWEPTTVCRHRHPDASSALACGQAKVDAMAVLR